MKALTLQAIQSPLVLEERDPLIPQLGHAIIDVRAAALNRRDYWITEGLYPGIQPPVVLGSDGAGVAALVADSEDESWLGKEVILNPGLQWGGDETHQSKDFHILGLPTDGTFAAQVSVPTSQLHERPAHLSWEESAALPLAGVTAWRAVFTKGQLRRDETILITGIGGGVATFALQFAVAMGANVWVTSSSDAKIARAIELGAKGGLNYKDEKWHKEFVVSAGEPSLIIDSAAGPGYHSLVSLAAPGGRIVNYGSTTGMPDKLDMFKVFWKQLTLCGTTMGSPGDFAAMLEFVNQHQIKPIVEATFPLKDGNVAIMKMKTSPQFGKYVLSVNQ